MFLVFLARVWGLPVPPPLFFKNLIGGYLRSLRMKFARIKKELSTLVFYFMKNIGYGTYMYEPRN